ncbi:hypothetical protein ACFL0W_04640 [Nanoarchaeota archaeon]
MEQETLVSILKWIFIIFIAGFIGYFGKHLSKWIIAKFSKQKPSAKPHRKTKAEMQHDLEKKKLKLEKKKIKVKKKKKR